MRSARSAALRSLASAAATALYDAISEAISPDQLEPLARLVWRGYADDSISEADATYLSGYIERRRPLRRLTSQMSLPGMLLPAENAARTSCYPKRPQRSPDRQKSYDRRHRLAFSGVMPPHLAAALTIADVAVMRVVADEYRARAVCDLSLGEIAARAGVCAKTARRAMAKAKAETLISIELRPVPARKNRTNLVKIISLEWLKWLRRPNGNKDQTQHARDPKVPRPPDIGGHFLPPTDITSEDDSPVAAGSPTAGAECGRQAAGPPSKEAVEFACELASIAGHRRGALPESWTATNPPQIVQTWLDALADTGSRRLKPSSPVDQLRRIASLVMRRKPDRAPPRSPRYFTSEIAKSLAQRPARSRCAA
jgi:hypothetical protein